MDYLLDITKILFLLFFYKLVIDATDYLLCMAKIHGEIIGMECEAI